MVIKHWRRSHASICAVWLLGATFLCCGSSAAHAQTSSVVNEAKQGATMIQHAKGTFDVKVIPQDNKSGDATLGHLLLEKQLHGDLEGTSRGQMLAANTAVEGSAGYVAIERVTGTLQGRSGSFVLQHVGHMGRGQMQLTVTVLPNSGTEQLQGLSGTLRIIIENGKHYYEFDYSIEASP